MCINTLLYYLIPLEISKWSYLLESLLKLKLKEGNSRGNNYASVKPNMKVIRKFAGILDHGIAWLSYNTFIIQKVLTDNF